MANTEPYDTFRWVPVHEHGQDEDGYLLVLDQREIPHQVSYVRLVDYREVAEAIRDMVVRGAPAIGAVAAYGYVLGIKSGEPEDQVYHTLYASRPTAVNLQWALDALRQLQTTNWRRLLWKANELVASERLMNNKIAAYGAEEILKRWKQRHHEGCKDETLRVLHHCNTGSLATAGGGTALGVIRKLAALHGKVHVHVNETRPRLQGARLTCWELRQWGIPYELSVDAAAPFLMAQGRIQFVTVGADRIAADGAVANKIGTLMIAIAAQHYGIPFYVCAPCSTIDLKTPTGAAMIIEERSATEVLNPSGKSNDQWLAPVDTPVYNPAFDITPPELITGGIVTELGILRVRDQAGAGIGLAEQLQQLEQRQKQISVE